MYASQNIFLVRFYKNSMLLKEVDKFSTQGMKRTNKKFQKLQEHDQTDINLSLPTELLVVFLLNC